MSDEVTTHQIKGICAGFTVRGEWREYPVDVGRQYPVKLATKQPDVQAAAEAAIDKEAVWTYTERDGNENPHKPGTFYKNRYVSSVVVGGVLDPALAGQQSSSTAQGASGNQGGSMPTEGREVSIERQTIIKAAVAQFSLGSLVKHDPDSLSANQDEFFKFLDRLDDWMGRARGGQRAASSALPAEGLPADTSTADDEGIPF